MTRMQRVAFVAGGVLVVGLWLPWANVTVTLFGAESPILEADGEEIGSGILDLPVGWIALGSGVAGIVGALRRSAALVLVAGVVATIAVGYTLLAIPGEETTLSAEGVDISEVIRGEVEYAWGLFVVTAGAVALLAAGVALRREDARSFEPEARAVQPSADTADRDGVGG